MTACPACLALFADARSHLPESEAEPRVLEALLEDPEMVWTPRFIVASDDPDA